MTSDAADREKKLANAVGLVFAQAIAAFVDARIAAHEQSVKAMIDKAQCDMIDYTAAVMASHVDAMHPKPPAAEPPAIEHKPNCRTRCVYWPKPFDACLEHPDGHTCDCGASDPKAGDDVCPIGCPNAHAERCVVHRPSDPKACAVPARLDSDRTAKGKTILTAPVMGENGPSRWPGNASSHIDTETGVRTSLAPDREAPKPPIPDRITLYWARSQLGGVHIDTHGGEWNAQPLVPFEVVQSSALTEALDVLRLATNLGATCPNLPGSGECAHDFCLMVRRALALLARHGVKS